MPTVAFKIRERAQDPRGNLQDVAEVAQADGAIAGRLLHVANSVAFANGPRVRTVLAAVQRLGLTTTQYLVLSPCPSRRFASRDQESRRPPWMAGKMQRCRERSLSRPGGGRGAQSRDGANGRHSFTRQAAYGPRHVGMGRVSLGETHYRPAPFSRITKPLSLMVHRYWDLDEPCLDAMRHWDE